MRVAFFYSWIYDQHWQEDYQRTSREFGPYPKPQRIQRLITARERAWRRVEASNVWKLTSSTSPTCQPTERRGTLSSAWDQKSF